MKIAIHHEDWAFSTNWIKYMDKKKIDYKVFNFYDSDIIDQIRDFDIVMWHHTHLYAKDKIFAKQLLFALEQAGKKVFPNFNSNWHFDDKLGQKYLFEALDIPSPNSYAFYSKKDAVAWVNKTTFPKVFKLRAGAGSYNVSLVHNKSQAIKLVNKAFGAGFPIYSKWNNLKDTYAAFKRGTAPFFNVMKSMGRVLYSTNLARTLGREKGYVYFQDFLPNNDHDIRVIVIENKAFAIKRLVRDNDFRASGSGKVQYDKNLFKEELIFKSFEMAKKLNTQCVGFDFVFDKNNNPLVVEINYGFDQRVYLDCPGYWDNNLNWHEGKFTPEEWMVELMLKS